MIKRWAKFGSVGIVAILTIMLLVTVAPAGVDVTSEGKLSLEIDVALAAQTNGGYIPPVGQYAPGNPNFGYETPGSSYANYIGDGYNSKIAGSVFTIPQNGTADSITFYGRRGSVYDSTIKAAIYKHSDLSLVGETGEITISYTVKWWTLNFSAPKPSLIADTEYVLVLYSQYTSGYGFRLYYSGGDENQGHNGNVWQGYPIFPDPWVSPTHNDNKYSIYCTYTVANQPPDAPSLLGPPEYVDGSWGTDNTPTLTFTQSDPDSGDTVQYTVQIDDSSDFSSPVADYTSGLLAQGGASFTVGQAVDGGWYAVGSQDQTLPEGDYYWQVMSTDEHGATSDWSVANGGDIAFQIDTTPQSGGSTKDRYRTNEDVYVTASGFLLDSDINIYVVGDSAWSDGDPILGDEGDGMDTIHSDGSGNLGPVVIWSAPLKVGEYDVVFDADQNGDYDEIPDLVDHPGVPGFRVLSSLVGGEVYPINKAAILMPWLGLTLVLFLATASGALILRRRRTQ